MTEGHIPVHLSTSSVYPENAAYAFDVAQRLGYDGVEIMVWTDPVTQEAGALNALARLHEMSIGAIHAPTLLLAQRLWGAQAVNAEGEPAPLAADAAPVHALTRAEDIEQAPEGVATLPTSDTESAAEAHQEGSAAVSDPRLTNPDAEPGAPEGSPPDDPT